MILHVGVFGSETETLSDRSGQLLLRFPRRPWSIWPESRKEGTKEKPETKETIGSLSNHDHDSNKNVTNLII